MRRTLRDVDQRAQPVPERVGLTDFPTQAGCTESGADAFCAGGSGLTRIDVLSAGGNDRVEIPDGANIDALLYITFGPGDDQLSVDDSNLQNVTASGGDGDESFFTGPGYDVLDGGAGDDGLNTGTGRDAMLGGFGYGGSGLGTDTILSRLAGASGQVSTKPGGAPLHHLTAVSGRGSIAPWVATNVKSWKPARQRSRCRQSQTSPPGRSYPVSRPRGAVHG